MLHHATPGFIALSIAALVTALKRRPCDSRSCLPVRNQNLEIKHMFFAFVPIKDLKSLAKIMRKSC
jgi:hypothetical protein